MGRKAMHGLIGATILVGAPLMGGCLVSQRSSTKIDGAYVQPSDLSKVRLNRSTDDDVLNLLGEPSDRITNDDGTETWSWHWTRRESGSGHVFLVFSGTNEKEVDESAHVTFEYGVAIEKWRD